MPCLWLDTYEIFLVKGSLWPNHEKPPAVCEKSHCVEQERISFPVASERSVKPAGRVCSQLGSSPPQEDRTRVGASACFLRTVWRPCPWPGPNRLRIRRAPAARRAGVLPTTTMPACPSALRADFSLLALAQGPTSYNNSTYSIGKKNYMDRAVNTTPCTAPSFPVRTYLLYKYAEPQLCGKKKKTNNDTRDV